MCRYTLSKTERLTDRKLISQINDKKLNTSLHQYPLIFAWVRRDSSENPPVRILFRVSRKNFRKAVDRNRIKRMLRTLYRYRKPELYAILQQKKHEPLALMIVYMGKEYPEFSGLKLKFDFLFDKFAAHIQEAA